MCCSGCFRDEFLRDFIGREGVPDGRCRHCDKEGLPQVEPARLTPYFEIFFEAYSARTDGRPINELISEDWLIFDSDARDQLILEEVLGRHFLAITYVPRESASAPSGDFWMKLRTELQEENRFFPDNAPDRRVFTNLMANLVRTELPAEFFRARLMLDGEAIPVEKMGAPPADLASDGRANPVGIRYLYLADEPETAIAEVKPSKGAVATVARFEVAHERQLSLVDLTNPRATISPFKVSGSIADVRSSMAFLEALGEELSIPAQPHRATRDYLASQYLCELIKVCGHDGVVYRSSLAGGKNYAFFDVDACTPSGERWIYRVTDVQVVSQIEQQV